MLLRLLLAHFCFDTCFILDFKLRYYLSLSCFQEELVENEGEKQDNFAKGEDEKVGEVKEKREKVKKESKQAGSLEYLVDVTVAYPEGKILYLALSRALCVTMHHKASYFIFIQPMPVSQWSLGSLLQYISMHY